MSKLILRLRFHGWPDIPAGLIALAMGWAMWLPPYWVAVAAAVAVFVFVWPLLALVRAVLGP